MMKQILLLLVASLVSLQTWGGRAGTTTQGDRWVPWPWALAQPVDWKQLTGLWRVQTDSGETYFLFKAVNQPGTGLKQLQIKQLQGSSCKTIATGVGIEKGSRILAQMTSKTGSSFRLYVTAFRKEDSPNPPVKGGMDVGSVMVVSVKPLGSTLGSESHWQMMKLSGNQTVKTCEESLRN